jgi:hypothetical protein
LQDVLSGTQAPAAQVWLQQLPSAAQAPWSEVQWG